MGKNEVNINDTHMYRLKPENNWKLIRFDGKHKRKINDKEYFPEDFINSSEFHIHDIITFVKIEIGASREYFHIWYEEKK
ncbi:hypothetical protein ACFFIX_19660 [Metabacillus herbersteinensis]|uniref:Uncharacterized protein n=1 Tax=Metabacillus herbersteinensis TaxID=283816 RepID=A0ABV6GL11_9BACI